MDADQFREIRVSLGLSQETLGAVLGYSRLHVWQMENQRRVITRPVALVMEAMLDGWRPTDYPTM